MFSVLRRTPAIASRSFRMFSDEGHITDDKKGGFAKREKSLEEQYIRKKEAEEIKKFREELSKLKDEVEKLKNKDD